MSQAVECFLTVESKRSGLHKDVVANYFQKLPSDTPNVVSASSGWMSRETEESSKELKKMQGEKRKKYCMQTPKQQLAIGKHAAKNANASTF